MIKHAITIMTLLSVLLLGISSAYFPANIVAGSYYSNIITNFSGYGLTSANITVLSKINTTDYYLFSFNDSANGMLLNCTAPYANGSDSDYLCFGYNRSIKHNTILNLYGLIGNATNYISQNLSILAVAPQHPYEISTEIFLNGNVIVNESVQAKIINITDINSSKNSFMHGITLNCQRIGPSYITGNLTLTFYPAQCYYGSQLNLSSIDTNSIIQNAVLGNVISNRLYHLLQYQNVSIEVYKPLNLTGRVPRGYSGFYYVGAKTYYNGSYLPTIAEVQSVYTCDIPKGPLSGIEYYGNYSSYVSLYEYYKGNSECYLDFYFPAGMNISIIQKLPVSGHSITTTTINTTSTTTTIPQHQNTPSPKSTVTTTTTTTTTTVTTTVPTTTIAQKPKNNNKNTQEENNTRNTAAVVVVVTSASTAAIGSVRRSGRR
ncbi:MAG: hypothetical protein QW814_03970 [Methanothrix sp.]